MAKTIVIYGSTTGNTEMVAEQIVEHLEDHEISMQDVADTEANDLLEYDLIIMGASTWDDGLLQADFREFAENTEIDLSGKKVAVFGLGDNSYPAFCESAALLEEFVNKLGGELIVEPLKIDGFPDEEENEEKVGIWCANIAAKL